MLGCLALTETVLNLLVLISEIFGPEYPKIDKGGGGGAALLIEIAYAATGKKYKIVETLLQTVVLIVWNEDNGTVVVGKVE